MRVAQHDIQGSGFFQESRSDLVRTGGPIIGQELRALNVLSRWLHGRKDRRRKFWWHRRVDFVFWNDFEGISRLFQGNF